MGTMAKRLARGTPCRCTTAAWTAAKPCAQLPSSSCCSRAFSSCDAWMSSMHVCSDEEYACAEAPCTCSGRGPYEVWGTMP